jgi:hypothetical protein
MYVGMDNNPVVFVDPDGNDVFTTIKNAIFGPPPPPPPVARSGLGKAVQERAAALPPPEPEPPPAPPQDQPPEAEPQAPLFEGVTGFPAEKVAFLEKVWWTVKEEALDRGVPVLNVTFLVAEAAHESGWGGGPGVRVNNIFSFQPEPAMVAGLAGVGTEKTTRVEEVKDPPDAGAGDAGVTMHKRSRTVTSAVYDDISVSVRAQIDVVFRIFPGPGRVLRDPSADINAYARALDVAEYATESKADPQFQQKALPAVHRDVVNILVAMIDRGPPGGVKAALGEEEAARLWTLAYSDFRRQLVASKR